MTALATLLTLIVSDSCVAPASDTPNADVSSALQLICEPAIGERSPEQPPPTPQTMRVQRDAHWLRGVSGR